MKKSQIVLIVLIILFLIIILFLSFLLTKNLSNESTSNIIVNNTYLDDNMSTNVASNFIEEINDNIVYTEKVVDYNKILNYVQDRTNYFTIASLYDKYINLIDKKETLTLINILSNEYKTTYNITIENLYDNINIKPLNNDIENYKITIDEILTAQIDKHTHIYIVKGIYKITNTGNDINNMDVMFAVNTSNNTFIVYPYNYINNNGYNNLKVGEQINYLPEQIKENKERKFSYVTKTDLQIVNEYLNHYKELLLYNKEIAYNKINLEYSAKKFQNIENFKTFLEKNKFLYSITLKEYGVKSHEKYADYTITDQYGNCYVFREEGGVMRYTVFLDTYTVETEILKEGYENSSTIQKININLEKTNQMLNHKDYETLYNKLDNTFKSNNYETIDKFKEFATNNFYNINKLSLVDRQSNSDYYVCTCTITDQENGSQEQEIENQQEGGQPKQITIIMKLLDNNDFVMSFSM